MGQQVNPTDRYNPSFRVSIGKSRLVFLQNQQPTFRGSLKCSENFERLRRRSCYNSGFEVLIHQIDFTAEGINPEFLLQNTK